MKRLVTDDADLDAEQLQDKVVDAGADAVRHCSRGAVVTVTGRLTSVVFQPKDSTPTLEAELFDGSGTVTLVWLGRRRIPGIEPGRVIVAAGRVAICADRRVLFNPRYELKAAAS